MSDKIATESEAYNIVGKSNSSIKCCTYAKATEIGCEVNGSYSDNQLVLLKDLAAPDLSGIYYFYINVNCIFILSDENRFFNAAFQGYSYDFLNNPSKTVTAYANSDGNKTSDIYPHTNYFYTNNVISTNAAPSVYNLISGLKTSGVTYPRTSNSTTSYEWWGREISMIGCVKEDKAWEKPFLNIRFAVDGEVNSNMYVSYASESLYDNFISDPRKHGETYNDKAIIMKMTYDPTSDQSVGTAGFYIDYDNEDLLDIISYPQQRIYTIYVPIVIGFDWFNITYNN